MNEELEREALAWHNDASAFLADTCLVDLLSPYGRVVFTGSYAYGCMLGGDIDCYVVADDPPSRERALGAVEDLAASKKWNGIMLFDWEQFSASLDKGFPSAYYVGLKQPYRSFRWTVDCWFLTEEQCAAYTHEWIVEGMHGASLEAVLHLKDAKRSGLIKGSGFSIYTAVIRDGVVDIDAYETWWQTVWRERQHAGSWE